MPEIHLLLHNIRSTYNVGSIFRTADGFGISKIWLTGYTPYPEQTDDQRLPHLRRKIEQQIHKTALGAENTVSNYYQLDPMGLIKNYQTQGWVILALEQAPDSCSLSDFTPTKDGKYLLILGEEVAGITPELLASADQILEIPMRGHKESFNVSVAAGIALFHLSQS